MLALTADDAKRQRQLAVIQRATAGMDTLVTELLDMARIESGAFEIRQESVDIVSLIRDVVEMFDPQALNRKITLRVEIEGTRKDAVPSPFTKMHLVFIAKGAVDDHKLQRAVKLSVEKYCSVSATLGDVEVTWEARRDA